MTTTRTPRYRDPAAGIDDRVADDKPFLISGDAAWSMITVVPEKELAEVRVMFFAPDLVSEVRPSKELDSEG